MVVNLVRDGKWGKEEVGTGERTGELVRSGTEGTCGREAEDGEGEEGGELETHVGG